CEMRAHAPDVAGVKLLLPGAEAAVEAADACAKAAGRTHPEIGEGVAAEIVRESKRSPIAARFTAVGLQPVESEADGDDVPSGDAPQVRRIAEAILHPIDGENGAGSQRIDRGADRHRRSDGVWLGRQQRVKAVEAKR